MNGKLQRSIAHLKKTTAGLLAGAAFSLASTGTAIAQPVSIGDGLYFGWAPFYVAHEQQLWQKQGLEPTVTQFPSGRQALDAVLAGRVAFAAASETPPIFAALNGQPIRIIAVFNKLASFDVVADKSIKTAADLKGKKIGYANGTNAHFYLHKLLQQQGWKDSDVVAVNLLATDFPTALANGDIDAFIWGEPMVSQAISRAPDRLHVLKNPANYFGYSVVFTRQETLDQQPEVLVKAIKALQEATAFINANPDATAEIVSERIKFDLPLAKQVLQSLDSRIYLDDEQFIRDLNEQAQWAISSGIVRPGTQLPDLRKTLLAPSVLEAANAK